jgi:hypothetical protein
MHRVVIIHEHAAGRWRIRQDARVAAQVGDLMVGSKHRSRKGLDRETVSQSNCKFQKEMVNLIGLNAYHRLGGVSSWWTSLVATLCLKLSRKVMNISQCASFYCCLIHHVSAFPIPQAQPALDFPCQLTNLLTTNSSNPHLPFCRPNPLPLTPPWDAVGDVYTLILLICT